MLRARKLLYLFLCLDAHFRILAREVTKHIVMGKLCPIIFFVTLELIWADKTRCVHCRARIGHTGTRKGKRFRESLLYLDAPFILQLHSGELVGVGTSTIDSTA